MREKSTRERERERRSGVCVKKGGVNSISERWTALPRDSSMMESKILPDCCALKRLQIAAKAHAGYLH